ncbi:hypothetical protein M3Y98_00452200 [Aphelenchoides besseyi]|nr:hypothetical protein M3Y98_00452200 [Aphelenchoides besseyi]KAI6207404.1 hypothetical protein M3Y96_00005500 [Aphelenchoides besseyi]
MKRDKSDRNFNYPLHVQVNSEHTPSSSPAHQNYGAVESLGLPTPSTSVSRETTPFSPPRSPGILRNGGSIRHAPNHFHLPAYRLVADLELRPRSAGARLPTPTSPPNNRTFPSTSISASPTQCFRCGHRQRDPTWLETEVMYDLMTPASEVSSRSKLTAIAERAAQTEIERKLQAASDELERLVDELDALSTTRNAIRSKSTPDFNNPKHNSPLQQNGRLQLSPQSTRYYYNLRKEEMLTQQRVEKFNSEIEDQQNRRHGYLPNMVPSLANDLSRLEMVLHDFRQNTPSTPLKSRSRSLSSYSLRSTQDNPLTCTALYRFEAQSPRELPLNIGDTVYVRRKVDENWIEGERNGHVGIIPISFVRFNV